jgi:hypothetical protein
VISLRLPRAAYDLLKAQADAEHRPLGSLIRHIILSGLSPDPR